MLCHSLNICLVDIFFLLYGIVGSEDAEIDKQYFSNKDKIGNFIQFRNQKIGIFS